ncbi:hypothetical protein PPSIR1_05693 [Plesiocystis pacifica SIR-1]|uniref:Lipoprotein n=1 Tax=Plesiocystis pacifica SIR-1 TaxID=391625 RepID=A6FXB1_9BACT|nr:hypothetical protein [Plesiocystis pacifica]EDM81935.1 hypothetical protein PPSIR1_05693 [Plesiocystis pacifica SIR-1]
MRWRNLAPSISLCSCLVLPVALGCAASKDDAGGTKAPAEAGMTSESGAGVVAGGSPSDGLEQRTELPASLVAELRLVGDDASGRLLTLSPRVVATAACSDCGAPSYLRFVALRCRDDQYCEVLTESCEGSVAQTEAGTFELAFTPIAGVEVEAGLCEGFTGSYEVLRQATTNEEPQDEASQGSESVD